jgi:hypothetical protein
MGGDLRIDGREQDVLHSFGQGVFPLP